jgi:hypothetical protein
MNISTLNVGPILSVAGTTYLNLGTISGATGFFTTSLSAASLNVGKAKFSAEVSIASAQISSGFASLSYVRPLIASIGSLNVAVSATIPTITGGVWFSATSAQYGTNVSAATAQATLGRITNISTSYINAGTVAISTGGEALKLYPGVLNTAYMGFYAVSLNSGTRTGNIGYSAAGGVLCITNELSNADINIKTTGAAANIALKPGGYLSLEGFTNVTTTFSAQGSARFPSDVSIASGVISSGHRVSTYYRTPITFSTNTGAYSIFVPGDGHTTLIPVFVSAGVYETPAYGCWINFHHADGSKITVGPTGSAAWGNYYWDGAGLASLNGTGMQITSISFSILTGAWGGFSGVKVWGWQE